jgi:hypothetical protein
LFLTPALYLMMENVRARFRRPPPNGIHPAPDRPAAA